jgi:DNA polymerase-1
MRGWDIETTTKTSFKRKANPFDPENWVVTHAFADDDARPTEYRFGSKRPEEGWLRPVLKGCKLLAGFNIKFDLLHALQDPENLEAWMEYIADGGMIWDVQLAEYLLEGMDQKNQMLSLDEVAPRYGGDLKFDEVKVLWAAGVQTQDIEPALLSRYLCGRIADDGKRELGDVENTLLCARGQIQRARDCGQLRSIMLNQAALVCSVEMERNGMYVDKEAGLRIAESLRLSLLELEKALDAYLPPNLPFDFKWTNRYHLSPLIFGGSVKYQQRQYDLKDGTTTWDAPVEGQDNSHYAFAQMDVVCVWPLDSDTPIPLDEAKAKNIPVVRYSSGKNTGEPKTKKVKQDDPSKPKSRMADRLYPFPGFTHPEKKWASETPGLYSVASEVIEELGARDIPFLKTLAEVAAMSKDLGTYYITTDPKTGESKGMLILVGPDGIIHHKINHTNTVTGRLSSSDPNLQNLSKGNKSQVKTIFVSRFGPDGKIIQSDFSSLEVYVQAILTKCAQLIADLKAGLDMHVKRLAVKEGISYEECYALCKGDKYDKEWDYKRTGAKGFSFQRAYGAGAAKIAGSTGMHIDDVLALIAAEDIEYPEIKAHFEARALEIKKNRRPNSVVTVPHPDCPGVVCHLGMSYIRTPDGKLYAYRESPSPEYLVKRGVNQSFSPTEIKNYEVQGTGGEWAKAAMLLAVRAFYRERNFGGLALLVNQVHDANYVDAHNSVAFRAAALLHACMEAASDYMEWWFNWPVPVPVPSDTTWGKSMAEEEKIDGIKELAAQYRQGLRDQYMNGYKPSFIH